MTINLVKKKDKEYKAINGIGFQNQQQIKEIINQKK